jgi:hypothetical protein
MTPSSDIFLTNHTQDQPPELPQQQEPFPGGSVETLLYLLEQAIAYGGTGIVISDATYPTIPSFIATGLLKKLQATPATRLSAEIADFCREQIQIPSLYRKSAPASAKETLVKSSSKITAKTAHLFGMS